MGDQPASCGLDEGVGWEMDENAKTSMTPSEFEDLLARRAFSDYRPRGQQLSFILLLVVHGEVWETTCELVTIDCDKGSIPQSRMPL